MTINPIKIIRDRREWKLYVASEQKTIDEQRIRYETIDWLSKNGMLKSSVS